MRINEVTQFNRLLAYVDPVYHDLFCDAWYIELDRYKEDPNSILMFANAILAHWDVPLYAESIAGWDDNNECFIWKFTKKEEV